MFIYLVLLLLVFEAFAAKLEESESNLACCICLLVAMALLLFLLAAGCRLSCCLGCCFWFLSCFFSVASWPPFILVMPFALSKLEETDMLLTIWSLLSSLFNCCWCFCLLASYERSLLLGFVLGLVLESLPVSLLLSQFIFQVSVRVTLSVPPYMSQQRE